MLIEDDDPVKPGYIRIYVDHTGRWYHDISDGEHRKELYLIATSNEPEYALLRILQEEIQKEVDAVISLELSVGKRWNE